MTNLKNRLVATPEPEDSRELTILPELPFSTDVAQLLARTAGLRDILPSEFVQGVANLPWYTSQLQGTPFVVTSAPVYETEDASQKRQFAQEVVKVTVRKLDIKGGQLLEAHLAKFAGRYMLNQFRGMTLRELTAPVWTVAENTLMDSVPTREHTLYLDEKGKPISYPYMLKLYNPATDAVPAWLQENDNPTF